MGSLFDTPSPPPTPRPAPPAPMPDDQSPLVREAGRRRTGEWANRGGRSSTILSQDEGSNEAYSRRTLG